MNPPFNSKSKVLALCMLLGVVLSGWLLFSIEKERRDSVPTQDDWAKFRVNVAPLLEDGDVIRFAPVWDGVGPAAFQGIVSNSVRAPFPALDWRVYHDPIRWMGFERLVVVGWSNYVEKEIEALKSRFGKATLIIEEGLFAAYSLQLPANPIRWNALDNFSDAKVRRVDGKKKAQACPWNGSVHDCPGRGGWRDVKTRRMLVGDVAQTCIYMEPSPDGASVEIMFEKLTISAGQTLLVRAGNSMEAARRNAGGPLTLQISVDGTPVSRDTFHHHDFTWTPYGVTFSDALPQGLHRVNVSLSAEKSGYRQECVEVLLLDEGWEAWGVRGYGHRFREPVSEEQVKLSSFP